MAEIVREDPACFISYDLCQGMVAVRRMSPVFFLYQLREISSISFVLTDISLVAARESHEQYAKKKSSVIGNAITGAVIAGPTGAIVGALHAVDKNMNNQ